MENDKQSPTFIIDTSVLQDMFEGKNKERADDLLKKLKEMNDKGMDVKVLTTLSVFLRAIFLSNSKVEIGKIQKVLSFLHVFPSFADFKNKDEVMSELLKFVHLTSGRGKSKEE